MVREQVITKNLVNRCYMLDAQPPSILKSKQKKKNKETIVGCMWLRVYLFIELYSLQRKLYKLFYIIGCDTRII